MPPRKSDSAPPRKSDTDDGATSISAAAADESRLSTTDKRDKDKESKDGVTIEDVALPKSIIARLAKGVLPPNTQIQANAIIAMSKSVTVFINYLASHANEHTMAANKKTISPADVFRALDDVEFSFLKEPLEAEFARNHASKKELTKLKKEFNQIQIEKRTNYRRKVRTKPDGDGDGDDAEMADATVAGTTVSSERDAGPRTKKARVDDDAAEEDDAETEEEGDVQEEDEDEEDEDEGEEEEEEEEEEHHDGDAAAQASGDETQDALEERLAREEGDEALDGDESD